MPPRSAVARKLVPQPTTAQALGSLLKSARDIMRKDKGLNGDLDRLPLLTWIMFLKFLDDLEIQRDEEAVLAGRKFRAAMEPPYRWRDWAANPQDITGDELLAFINQDECMWPDGQRGAGLFAYLRGLTSSNGDDRRDVIATVFRGVDNRMRSGYLLRDVINKVADIHFTSSEELHTLGALYETMLREMRDAAGDSGEFYTPRAVVRFMVEVTDPRLGETVLDPAAGTGGFLVEAFNHLSKQVRTVADRKLLQGSSLSGCEPKSLPYLLCQMNLLLHGLDAPKIDPGNALRFKLSEIGERDRVDMILTNPPFGGEEEKGIQGNFSDDRQTAETALLFLQLIMRKLRRQPTVAGRPARAAVVVPNGILYGDGVCARIKEELLKDFNLHTIVRLPSGVFAPYTNIPTNILFFDRSSSTSEIWYYEHALSEGRKNYTKTAPLQFEELRSCIDWWQRRQKDDQSWKVPVHEVIADGYNLDRKNPNRRAGNGHRRPAEIATDILTTERQILNTLTQLQELLRDTTENLNLSQEGKSRCGWRQCLLGECLRLSLDVHHVQPDQTYQNLGIYSFGRGLFLKPSIDGVLTSATTLNRVKKGQFIYSRLFAFEGAYGVVSEEFDGFFVSNEYPTFDCINERVKAEFLSVYFKSPSVWHTVAVGSKGLGDRRQRVQPQQILNHVFWLPPIEWQDQVVKIERQVRSLGQYQSQATTALGTLIPTIIDRSFGYL